MGACCSCEPEITRNGPSRVLNPATGVVSDPAHISSWLPADEADRILMRVQEEVPFEKNPRWSFFYRLQQSAYYYSEKARKKTPIPILEELAAAMESSFQCNVFTVWCNLYEDGGDHVEWHQDQYGCDMFTLSLGATRKFLMRPKGKKGVTACYELSHGDLFFLSLDTDKKHEHSIQKEPLSEVAMRISFVFYVDFPGSKTEGWRYNPRTGKYSNRTSSKALL